MHTELFGLHSSDVWSILVTTKLVVSNGRIWAIHVRAENVTKRQVDRAVVLSRVMRDRQRLSSVSEITQIAENQSENLADLRWGTTRAVDARMCGTIRQILSINGIGAK